MEILGAKIDWSDGFDNSPHFVVRVDKTPKDLLYDIYVADNYGQSLSAEQMEAVGSIPKKTGKQIKILYAEDPSGYVTFVSVGSEKDYPKGAGAGTYKIRDVEDPQGWYEYTIPSGWFISSAVINNCSDLPEVIECSFITNQYRNLATAGFIRMDVLRPIVEKYLPNVDIIPTIDDRYTARIKGQHTKKTWRELRRVDLGVIKATICAELGVDPSKSSEWLNVANKVISDPRYKEVHEQEYSHLYGQSFTPYYDEGKLTVVCSLCEDVEAPDPQQEKLLQTMSKKNGEHYFINWCKHYHCCR